MTPSEVKAFGSILINKCFIAFAPFSCFLQSESFPSLGSLIRKDCNLLETKSVKIVALIVVFISHMSPLTYIIRNDFKNDPIFKKIFQNSKTHPYGCVSC